MNAFLFVMFVLLTILSGVALVGHLRNKKKDGQS